MDPSTLQLVATLCFFGALLHAFSAPKIESMAKKASSETWGTLLHFAGEIEIVFGLWAAIFTIYCITQMGFNSTLQTLEQKSFAEPIFVFVIMVIASTRPVLEMSRSLILSFSRILHRTLKIPLTATAFGITLFLTPLLGSLITEPATMTVGALILKGWLDRSDSSTKMGRRLLYSTVATLFVNVSIGGLLTNFAAPPVLMVARIWNWDTSFMFFHFAGKTILAVAVNTLFCIALNWKTLQSLPAEASNTDSSLPSPIWIRLVHLTFLALAVAAGHYPVFLIASFLFFLGFTQATSSVQSELKLREALLVSFFLGGLVILTSEQGWWLKPILQSLSDFSLFISATLLTAITDNAAITSLAAQVSDLAETSKFAVLEGAVAGGGLTLIANAPNPAGYAILRDRFPNGLEPITLFVYASIPTLIAGAFLWML